MQEKVLQLLANICSLLLTPVNHNEPFKPFKILENERSFSVEDLQPSDITLIAEMAGEVDDPLLQARLADLAWLLATPRNFRLALMAIDAYRKTQPDPLTWAIAGRDCFDRAVFLTYQLGRGAGTRLQEIEGAVLDAFRISCDSNPRFALELTEAMYRSRLGRGSATSIGTALVTLAGTFSSTASLDSVRECFGGAAKWFHIAGNSAEATVATVQVAAGWAKEAEFLLSAEKPSHLTVAHHIERAIQTYRSIPRASRGTHSIDDRILKLRTLLSNVSEKRVDDLMTVASQPIDLQRLILAARERLHEKTGNDALWELATVHGGAKISTIRDSAIQIYEKHPFQNIFDSVLLSRDGRVIARQPGSADPAGNAQANSTAVWAQMLKLFQIQLGIVVQGQILPALEEVSIINRFREDDLISIASLSPIVPYGREKLVGKALFLGLERDFVSAVHLLVPQIEHFVRFHLKANGEKTTVLDDSGIENELGLSALVESPFLTRIFGEDISFEIRALLCDPLGANLRNEIAHGLLDDTFCNTFPVVYAWHLGLRLVLISYWSSR